MYNKNLSVQVKNKAAELGFDLCGIIKVEEMDDYSKKLDERIAKFPDSKLFYETLYKYSTIKKNYEWAKSIIVIAARYGKYKIPDGMDKLIGKYYLFDYKKQDYSKEFEQINLFESYLKDNDIKFVKDIYGITSGRFAAAKAGLGIIRKNNFLYTKYGSWVWIETWITDKEMEYKESNDFSPCPDNCEKCIESCPTKALNEPYATNMKLCITCLTNLSRNVVPENIRDKMGRWLYGCDECQNSCPANKDKWEEKLEYPNNNKLLTNISLEKIMDMNDEKICEVLYPKFWYITPDRTWLWKCNVLRIMTNDYKPEYEIYIKKASNDPNENIKKVALESIKKLGL